MAVRQWENDAVVPANDAKAISYARLVARYIGVAVAVYGLLVICIWLFDIWQLKNLISEIISLKVTTALCFVLAGASLSLLQLDNPDKFIQKRARFAANTGALIIALLALLTLLEYAGWLNLGIDGLLVGGQYGVPDAGLSPRMAIYTSICFLLVAVALLMMDVRVWRNHLLSQYIAFLVGLLSFSVLIGYVFGAVVLYKAGSNIGMSINTVVVFLICVTGLVLARPEGALTSIFIGNKPGSLIIKVFVPIIVVLIALAGWLCLSGELSGYYPDSFWHAFFTEFCIVIVIALLFIVGILTNRMDSIRRQHEKDLQELAVSLEQKVQQRTLEYQNLNATMQESEQRFRLAFENADIGMCLVGLDGRYMKVNSRLCETFGYTREMMETMNMFDLTHPDDRMESLEMIKKAVAGELTSWHFEKRYIDSRGRIIFSLTAPALIRNAAGEPQYFVSQIMDVTDKKRSDEELARYSEHLEELVEERTVELGKKTYELEQKNIRLQELDRLKSVFLASMSHELRTPLNSIIGFTGILLQGMAGELTTEQKKQLSIVRKSAAHLLELINDILDISKIEAGKVELALEQFELATLVHEIADVFTNMAAEKGLDFGWTVAQDFELFSDRRRVKQVIMNFVSNAVKFTEKGSVSIKSDSAGNGSLYISVTDTGPGISKQDMDKLFLPFQQVDFSLTKKHEGTGLGLYLSRKIADLLHGEIIAKSNPGEGSEFIFVLPIKYQVEEYDEKSAGDRRQ